MASNGQFSGSPRDALHKALPRLYKFALVLAANEELARALLRASLKVLSARNECRDDDDRLTVSLRRMYALWAAKIAEDPGLHGKFPPDPRIFKGALVKGPISGNAHFASFISKLPSSQRGVLYLVYGEGASYDEAAEITGVNMLSLMKLLARGHLALSHWLDEKGLSEAPALPGFAPHLEREYAA